MEAKLLGTSIPVLKQSFSNHGKSPTWELLTTHVWQREMPFPP